MSIPTTGSPISAHFSEPITVSVKDAERLSSFGHTKLSEMIKDGRLKSTKIDGKRLINYASLKTLLGAE